MGAELLTVRIRYTAPDAGAEGSSEFPLVDPGTMFADASSDFRFAAAVAGFGMVLRDSPQMATTRLSDILDWAQKAAGTDRDRSRGEFISLVKRAGEILPGQG
jgi:Ca-activated chloride channel family protein